MRCSLWLLPPRLIADELQVTIQNLAEENCKVPRKINPPIFKPHVTIVGGIEIPENEDPAVICDKLKSALEGKFVNPIECNVKQQIDRDDRPENEVQWNQSYATVLKQTESLIALVDEARRVLQCPTEERFPPRLQAPHLSLFYGTEAIPEVRDLSIPESFYSTELALWKTEPSNLESVDKWEELTRINLVKLKNEECAGS